MKSVSNHPSNSNAQNHDNLTEQTQKGAAQNGDVFFSRASGGDAVVNAFSGDSVSEEAFRERWKQPVLEAQKRRERALAQRTELQKQLAVQKAKEERARILREAEARASAPIQPQNLQAGFPEKKPEEPEVQVYAGKVTVEPVYHEPVTPKGYTNGYDNGEQQYIPEQNGSFVYEEGEQTDGFVMPSLEEFSEQTERQSADVKIMDELLDAYAEEQSSVKTVSDIRVKKTASERAKFRIKTDLNKEGIKRFFVRHLPNKNDTASERVRKLINTISCLVLVAGLCYLAVYGVKYVKRIALTKSIGDEINSLQNLTPEQLEAEWKNIQARYPNVQFPEGMNIEYANLYAINQDVVGYLSIKNTNIETVLMQRADDNYYLYRDLYQQKSRYGNPFVSALCSMGKQGLSKNTIIYGHNTHDNLMFHQLTYYMTPEGYLNAPIITLNTLYETTKWKIFAVMLTNSTPEADNGYVFDYLFTSYASDEEFLNSMSQIMQRSMIHTGVDVTATDKTLMLYTCYQNIFSGGRLVVVARQLREGESEEVNTSAVSYNTNARFPQAYYDKKNLTNPYKTNQ